MPLVLAGALSLRSGFRYFPSGIDEIRATFRQESRIVEVGPWLKAGAEDLEYRTRTSPQGPLGSEQIATQVQPFARIAGLLVVVKELGDRCRNREREHHYGRHQTTDAVQVGAGTGAVHGRE